MSLIRQYNRPIAFISSTLGNLFITSGNLGINNTTPNNNLDISGTLNITSGNLLATFNSNTLGGVLITTGGNVGVNTSSPAYRLDLGGTLRINHPAPNGLYIGGMATGDPSLLVQSSHGTLELGIASGNGSYSASAVLGDTIIRSSKKLLVQCGSTIGNLCINTNGNIAIGATSQNTLLSITPSLVESKLTLWDALSSGVGNHYGFGVSNGQLNYHVDLTGSDHVFWAAGKNGNGTELLRIKGNGLIQSTNFRTIQVYTNNSIDWSNVNSSNFTVGIGSKFLIINFSWYTSVTGAKTANFDIYTSTNTLITTYTHTFVFSQTATHTPNTFLYVIPNSTMGAGTYYIKFRHNASSDINDYLTASIINFPFN